MTLNNALIQNLDKEDILATTLMDWLLMWLGLQMCRWSDQQSKYYLIGMPITWWGATASLLIEMLTFGVYVFQMHRWSVNMEQSA